MLQRGFWLYVWRVRTSDGECLYVGRTGDSSSPHASAPYQRMGQHLGRQRSQNALRRHLEKKGIQPEQCTTFQFVSHGPLFPQAADMEGHRTPRDTVAALEKALADALTEARYVVLNEVNCRKAADPVLFGEVRAAFAAHFPALLDGATNVETPA